MDHLTHLFEGARVWTSRFEFDRAYWVVLALLLVVCIHYLLVSTLLFRLAVQWLRPLTQLIRPELFPKSSVWRDRVASLRTWLNRPPSDSCGTKVIRSPRGNYQLLEERSGGDLSDVYVAWSNGRTYVLKHCRVPSGNRLLSKEHDILEQLLACREGRFYRQHLPWPVDNFMVADRRATVFVHREGFIGAASLLKGYPQGLDGRQLASMFSSLLEVLGYVHRQGWVHGAVLPPHLLFHTGSPGVQLLGWLHAQRRGAALHLVPARYKAWYPLECHRRRGATPATDIYLAARCILWLAGGNPRGLSIPARVPLEMRRRLQECLSDSPNRRPQDAWALQREITELLEGLSAAQA